MSGADGAGRAALIESTVAGAGISIDEGSSYGTGGADCRGCDGAGAAERGKAREAPGLLSTVADGVGATGALTGCSD